MNQSLKALMAKLNWQYSELHMNLKALEQDSLNVIQKIEQLAHDINQSFTSPLNIIPELEINKLNFITQQQEKKEELIMLLKNHQTLEKKLGDKIQRIKMEQKMLELYIEREQKKQKDQQNKAEEHALDEWVCQNRETR